jgi:hypothetical protein
LFGSVDICGDSPGLWIGALFISSWCATIAQGEAEKSIWATLGGFFALVYVYAAVATMMSGKLGTLWC